MKKTSHNNNNSNPYLDARQQWNERYGYALSSAKNWRLLCFVEALAIIILIIGYIYLSSRSQLQPYVVQVDQSANAVSVLKPEQSQITEGLKKTVLAGFIEDMRSISPDTALQKQRLTRVYSKIAAKSQARTKMDELFQQTQYFEKAKDVLVTTTITTVLPENDNTYTVEWLESIYSREDGQEKSKAKKKASITFQMGSLPNDLRKLSNNPIGLYVTTFNISDIY